MVYCILGPDSVQAVGRVPRHGCLHLTHGQDVSHAFIHQPSKSFNTQTRPVHLPSTSTHPPQTPPTLPIPSPSNQRPTPTSPPTPPMMSAQQPATTPQSQQRRNPSSDGKQTTNHSLSPAAVNRDSEFLSNWRLAWRVTRRWFNTIYTNLLNCG